MTPGNIAQLRAAIVAMPECEILLLGNNRIEDGEARRTGDGTVAVPGNVADRLLAAGRADLTDGTKVKLRADGVSI